METPSSRVGDANSPGTGAGRGEGDGSTTKKVEDDNSIFVLLGYPDAASYVEAKGEELRVKYMCKVHPKLQPVLAKDRVTKFQQLCCGWSHLMGRRNFILPEVLVSTISKNALRCAKAALQGDLLHGRRADPNGRHRYGFTPLHLVAETFSLDMLKLLLRHGASANLRTEGDNVIEGLLPLHVAVENASMHKYVEDHCADGRPLDKLISLLCLPEMKMYLDTVRLIAKHTDNIVDEVWNYINDDGKLVQLAILLFAAQKQLRDPENRSRTSLNGFDIIRRRSCEAIGSLHHQIEAMSIQGKNGSALKKLKNKKEALITAQTLVGIVYNAGEALERYIQTHSEVPCKEIIEHVSSILNSNGIVPSGKAIDPGSLKGYQYFGATLIDKSDSQVNSGEPNEADKSSYLNAEGSKMIPRKVPPKGLALRAVRNKFFPYWKSVLSTRLRVNMIPPCQVSMKDQKAAQGTKPSRKGIQIANRSRGYVTSMSQPHLAGRYEYRRQVCTAVLRSLKMLRRT